MITLPANHYDKDDIVRLDSVMRAGPLKVASYRVRDLETGEFSSLQFHMTYDNTVMAVMGEEAARLFAGVVQSRIAANDKVITER